MKSQTQWLGEKVERGQDKATATHSALPWMQSGNGIECADRYRVGSVNSIGTREGSANMDLIIKAVNEHAVLKDIAAAAKELSNLHDEAVFVCGKDDETKVDRILLQLNSCLAALDTKE